MLVVYALKNLIAWQTVGDIAIRLVPLILIGLTFMFAQFGSRTRDENPWAAYAFHALACVLVAFDIGSINRFWLEPIHLGLPHKPALLLACALGTALGRLHAVLRARAAGGHHAAFVEPALRPGLAGARHRRR